MDWEGKLQETLDTVLWEDPLGKSREKACVSNSAVPATAPAPEPTQEGGGGGDEQGTALLLTHAYGIVSLVCER